MPSIYKLERNYFDVLNAKPSKNNMKSDSKPILNNSESCSNQINLRNESNKIQIYVSDDKSSESGKSDMNNNFEDANHKNNTDFDRDKSKAIFEKLEQDQVNYE